MGYEDVSIKDMANAHLVGSYKLINDLQTAVVDEIEAKLITDSAAVLAQISIAASLIRIGDLLENKS